MAKNDRTFLSLTSLPPLQLLGKELGMLLPIRKNYLQPQVCASSLMRIEVEVTECLSLHCKNIWVTLTIFWSSQLHACCVRDKLQGRLPLSF